jgi:hypothetical protein
MNETLAGLRPGQRDALRIAGATAFAAGAFTLFLRKSATGDWAAFPKLLAIAIPCVLLYGLGIGALRLGREHDAPLGEARRTAAWRATATVLGLVMLPIALGQLVDTLGGDPNKSGHVAWLSLAVAGAAFFAAFGRGVRWAALFGGLAVIAGWMAFWDAIVDPSGTAVRWLFVLVAAALAAAAVSLRNDAEGPELATAAGVAAVAAGVTGLLSIPANFTGVLDAGLSAGETQQHQEWDAFLLAVALVLIWYGARAAWRGPAYVGAIGLLAFIVSAGYEVSSLFSDGGPSGDAIGWPLLLLVVGAAALLAGLYAGGAEPAPPAPDSPATPSRPDPPAAPM